MLPKLSAVLERIWEDLTTGELLLNTGLTVYRALTGFAIAAVLGIVLGMAISRRGLVHWFFDPIVSVGFPMPKIAFLPVVILWLGVYDTSKITMVAFEAIFPVVTATIIGIRGVERELIWSARNMGASETRVAVADLAAGGPAADHDRASGRAADRADRRHRLRDADGRLWIGRRHDDGVALRGFHAASSPASSRSRWSATFWSRAWRWCAGGCCCGTRRRSRPARCEANCGCA